MQNMHTYMHACIQAAYQHIERFQSRVHELEEHTAKSRYAYIAGICICMYVHVLVYVYVCMYMCVHELEEHTAKSRYAYVCWYIYLYICMYVCIHTYIIDVCLVQSYSLWEEQI
jgi:hypothetical protein